MPTVSLCTFTYNDASLLHGLLREVPGWTRQPDEILILDDGSAEPFRPDPELEKTLPLRLIRFPVNKGFIAAKTACLQEAGGEIILSADCDARLHPQFLEVCCRHLENPGVGMVSGPLVHEGGTGLLSKYLRRFGDNSQVTQLGPVDFIQGVAYALRRKVWEEVGGFSACTKKIGEDHVLCEALRNKGYSLLLDPATPVRQVRALSRFALCKRYGLWSSSYLKSIIPKQGTLSDFVAYCLINGLLTRITTSVQEQEQTGVYFDLLVTCYTILELCRSLGSEGLIPPRAGITFMEDLEKRLKSFPLLLRLLKVDLLALGLLPPSPGLQPDPENQTNLALDCDWDNALYFLDNPTIQTLLRWLDCSGVKEILREDADTTYDFSAYEQSDLA